MENQINIEELAKLAEQNDTTAIRKLADCYFDGTDTDKNYKKALGLYLKLTEQNDAEVLMRIGECYHSTKDDEEAFKWLIKSAELGNAKAQRWVGIFYDNAYGVPQNYKKAVEWYIKGAEQGEPIAQCNLGFCYDQGYGVPKDNKKATEWYTKSAKQGEPIAQCNLGINYYFGEGVTKSYKKAFEWWCKSAEQGNSIAQSNLGDLYRDGQGVEQNYEIAEQWYKKSAEQGNSNAKEKLDDLYEKGLVIPADAPRIQDADFGMLIYYGKNKWKRKTTVNFNGKESEFTIELEGTEKNKITVAQRKAYDEYQTKKDAFFEAMVAKAKQVYKGANKKKDNEIVPKVLYIDRKGNYGWVCDTAWNKKQISVILSDGDVQLAADNIVYKYADVIASRKKKEWYVDDSAFLTLFGELQELIVLRALYEFEDDEDEEICEGKLTDHEVDLLMWLTTELNTNDIAEDVVNYCNINYDMWCSKKIKTKDLLDEIELGQIYLKTESSADCDHEPDIALSGECECDSEHGIAIGFKDKKLLGVSEEDYAF